jgi:SPP1 family predicted phage head-tail adaptor
VIAAGRLNRRITIQRPGVAKDAYGHPSAGWIDVATVWAHIKPMSTRERIRLGAQESLLTHTVRVRYREDLMPPTTADAWRIVYGDRVLRITGAHSPDERRESVIFDCVEG